MAAYLIATIQVTDPEAYKLYTAETPALIAAAGGRFLVRGGRCEVVEGEDRQERIVVIEYPDMERALAFYHSDAYQKIVPLRTAASTGRMMIVEGHQPPT